MEYIGKGIASLGIGIAIACIGCKEPVMGMWSMLIAIFVMAAIWQ